MYIYKLYSLWGKKQKKVFYSLGHTCQEIWLMGYLRNLLWFLYWYKKVTPPTPHTRQGGGIAGFIFLVVFIQIAPVHSKFDIAFCWEKMKLLFLKVPHYCQPISSSSESELSDNFWQYWKTVPLPLSEHKTLFSSEQFFIWKSRFSSSTTQFESLVSFCDVDQAL